MWKITKRSSASFFITATKVTTNNNLYNLSEAPLRLTNFIGQKIA